MPNALAVGSFHQIVVVDVYGCVYFSLVSHMPVVGIYVIVLPALATVRWILMYESRENEKSLQFCSYKN